MDATLSILVLVGIIYLIFIIAGAIFIIKKRGSLKQTIDSKPEENFNIEDEKEKS